jgi:glycosyltransferase involved in cell wall biosynthesis
MDPDPTTAVAVVIPCFKVARHIESVVADLLGRVKHIYVVDDACPQGSGAIVEKRFGVDGVTVLRHATNGGVGAAMVTGYRAALADGCTIVVKMDGDGQMDVEALPSLLAPLLRGEADYTKGNRFFDIYTAARMPRTRFIGNAGLSFITKLSSGYWDVMDPTNGYTAIHRTALSHLPLDRLEKRYFFESDMLFRLSTIRAVVRDVPIPPRYGDETSSLRISGVLLSFPRLHAVRVIKRFFYMYLLRDFNVGTVMTLSGLAMLLFGGAFGLWHWIVSMRTDIPATTGTVMLSVLPIIVGVQLLLQALAFDSALLPYFETEPKSLFMPLYARRCDKRLPERTPLSLPRDEFEAASLRATTASWLSPTSRIASDETPYISAMASARSGRT